MDTQNNEATTPFPAAPRNIWETGRTLIKGGFIGFLVLVMLIPAGFIRQLVNEREARQQEVISEVSNKWAGPQTVKGPVLMIPYWSTVHAADKSQTRVRKHAYFLPETLNINGRLQPEVRHRSIYEVNLYRSQLSVSGRFAPPDFNALSVPEADVLWEEACLLMGISDLRGLEDQLRLNWSGMDSVFDPGLPEQDLLANGLHRKVRLLAGTPADFNIQLRIKGSGQLFFTPSARTTHVALSAPWPHPSFEGRFLPSAGAASTDSGFSADWHILQVSSGIPSCFSERRPDLDDLAFGVRLLQPADGYAKTQRSVKYALLFISLSFTVFFFIELLQKKQIHPLQYILVGLALCVFYTLLLSFTEYTGFNRAYAISATATVLLIGLYTGSIFRNRRTALIFTAALGGLYSYIFVLIQLQDYALLFGSIGLFLILALIMFYSRKIDWYGTFRQQA